MLRVYYSTVINYLEVYYYLNLKSVGIIISNKILSSIKCIFAHFYIPFLLVRYLRFDF